MKTGLLILFYVSFKGFDMSIPISTIKDRFRTGLKPTQSHFWDWIDSFWHKEELIPQAAISGLEYALQNFAQISDVNALKALTTVVSATSHSITIPAGVIVHTIRIKCATALNVSVGTTPGGSDILSAEPVSASVAGIFSVNYDAENATTLHFSGLSNSTSIKIYLFF